MILGGLALIIAGCAVLAFLRPDTPYAVVLVALGLVGAGNIAVITPVTEIVLGSVPAERSGSAAALNNAAMQVGGALGAATLTSVFLDAARSDYAARLTHTGLSHRQAPGDHPRLARRGGPVREHGRAGPARGDGARFRGGLPPGLHGRRRPRLRGAGLVALACAALAWFGLPRAAAPALAHGGPKRDDSPGRRP